MHRFNFNCIFLMFYISTIILILRKFPTRLQYWRKEKSLFDISRYIPSHLLSTSGRSRARRKTHAFLWGMDFLIRKVNLLQPILLFIAGIGNFQHQNACHLSFYPSLLKCACATWQAVRDLATVRSPHAGGTYTPPIRRLDRGWLSA